MMTAEDFGDYERVVASQEVYQSIGVLQGTQWEAARVYDIAAIEYRGINAVTNFDLSNYITWLKPSHQNPQDPKPETEVVLNSQALTSPSNYAPNTIQHSKPLPFDNTSFISLDHLNYPQNQEVFDNKMYRFSSSKSSSPTVLAFSFALRCLGNWLKRTQTMHVEMNLMRKSQRINNKT
ncbi:hypothetical protein HN51_006164 [Arachis hypogaea]